LGSATIFLAMNWTKYSCGMKDKDWKEVESIFKHDQEVLMSGFGFHLTEEELVEFYLRKKVEGQHFDFELITSVDLYRYDPWELPALASIGEKEWFFCSGIESIGKEIDLTELQLLGIGKLQASTG
jgi:hypothetical protein